MVGTTDDICNFAIVPSVTIEQVDDKNVTFSTRSMGVDGNCDQNLRRSFTVPRDEVYVAPIDGAPPPVAMFPGATGAMFLSRAGWQATTPDGFKIFGCNQAVFKWPTCAAIPTPPLTKLTVIPSSIVVRGHVRGDAVFFDLELLGDDAAESQDIMWNGGDHIELRLTASGAQRVGAASTTVEVWPTRITVKGSPAIDQAVVGEVDALDAELAGPAQHIAFARKGAAIALTLTQDGVNAFHIVPQMLDEDCEGSGAGASVAATPRDPDQLQRTVTRRSPA